MPLFRVRSKSMIGSSHALFMGSICDTMQVFAILMVISTETVTYLIVALLLPPCMMHNIPGQLSLRELTISVQELQLFIMGGYGYGYSQPHRHGHNCMQNYLGYPQQVQIMKMIILFLGAQRPQQRLYLKK